MIGPVPSMSVLVPPAGRPVTLARASREAAANVPPMHAPRVAAFFVTLWSVIAIAIPAAFYASTLLGSPPLHPNEYPFTAGIYLLWVPLVPAVVRLARRFAFVPGQRLRVALIHFGAALPIIMAKLVAHKMIFCLGFPGPYLQCALYIRLEGWLVAWYLYEFFVYGATVAGTWAFDARERTHRRELALAEKERALAAAELHAQYGRIAPAEMTSLFASISAKIHEDANEAERMITRVADHLRLTVQSMR